MSCPVILNFSPQSLHMVLKIPCTNQSIPDRPIAAVIRGQTATHRSSMGSAAVLMHSYRQTISEYILLTIIYSQQDIFRYTPRPARLLAPSLK